MKSPIFHAYGILLLIMLAGLTSCSSSSSSPLISYGLIHEEKSIGEFLKTSPKEWVTADRSSSSGGLIRIDPQSHQIEVLDPTAFQAKDIFLSDSKILYRVDKEIRFWNSRVQSLKTNALKIWNFIWCEDYGLLFYQNTSRQNLWLRIRSDGSILDEGTAPGEGREILEKDKTLYWFYNQGSGFYLLTWPSSEAPKAQGALIEAQVQASYVDARFLNERLWVAYQDHGAGTFKMASRANTESPFLIEVVDGTPNQTYVGMDPAIFKDQSTPGIVYMDGWKLKLRLARKIEGQWKTQEIPIQGAVGFYTNIISESSDEIQIAFHNFRSQIDTYEARFENLAIARLKLSH